MAKQLTTKGRKPVSELPWFYIQFLDKDQTTELTPSVNLPELKAPDFKWEKDAVVDAFWSPKQGETLPDAKLRLKVIPRFPADSGCEGPGLYPALIMLSGGSRLETLHKMEEQRLQKPSSKCIEALLAKGSKSSKSSGSSGYASSSSSSNVKKRKRANEKEVEGSSGDNNEVARKSKRSKGDCTRTRIFQCEDDDDGDFAGSDSDDSMVPSKTLKPLQDQIEVQDRKIKKQKDKIKCLEEELKKAEEAMKSLQVKFNKVYNFNVIYQEHISQCLNSTLSDSHKNKVEQSTAESGLKEMDKPTTTTEISPATELQRRNVPKEVAASTVLEKTEATKPQKPDENSSNAEPKKTTDKLSPSDSDGQLNDGEEELKQTEPDPEGSSHQEQTAKSVSQEGASCETSDSDRVEIYDQIFIAKEAHTDELKKILNRVDPSKDGKDHDKEFVMRVTEAVFTEVELATHTLTGTISNIQRGLMKKGLTTSACPPLDCKRVEAIKNVFFRRLMMEKELIPQTNVEERKNFMVERFQLKTVNLFIGASCNNAKRRANRAAAKISKEQEAPA